jgi:hypothetical protein
MSTLKTITPLLALTAFLTAPALAETTVIDDFEDGENIGGWIIGGHEFIDESGGNPGAWLHEQGLFTFAPIVRTSFVNDNPYVGDFRAMGVTGLSFDAQTLARAFGDPVGFQMSLLLRDTKGTSDPEDDDYAYFVGDQVPLIGQGWLHYDFAIPSASEDPVPDGWSGGWGGDLENFRPGVDWNDVITNVDQVEIWWLHPAFFAIIVEWETGVDNITMTMEEVEPIEGDLDGSGSVDVQDLLILLGAWGPCADCPADLNGDGVVNIMDLLALLANWG